MNTAQPDFSQLERPFFTRYGTRTRYQLMPISDLEVTPQHLADIQRICSEPEVHRWLFAPEAYTLEKAKGFVEWGQGGWQAQSHFVFLMLDPQQRIAGAIDIKSPHLAASEVGYWVSQEHTGIASAALAQLVKIATQAGYCRLFAQVKPGNEKSVNVLTRNGFVQDNTYKTQTYYDRAFCLALKNDSSR